MHAADYPPYALLIEFFRVVTSRSEYRLLPQFAENTSFLASPVAEELVFPYRFSCEFGC
jgi:hypothetical protein